MPEDTIVIPVDASSFSTYAYDWYVEHMHKPDNHIILVHCMELPAMPSRDTWESQTKDGKDKGKTIEDMYTIKAREKNVSFRFIAEFEKPGHFIVKVADKEKASAIVMGTRGLGKISRTILGSVSNYVLNHAHCPVMVCRSPKD